jgi:bifunctional non-homologous end joining protein LigD
VSLEEYSKKRAFEKTPEPKPASGAERGGRRFCVQRHHARRLHYDLRLEIGGALKSWAVPQGPTLEALAKRLAVMVEDHPLEYGDFEGNIPKGNYGAGSVMLWDQGTYELTGDRNVEAQLERGDLKFRLFGEKLRGEFALVRMKSRGKGNEWLLIKKRDPEAQPGWDPEGHAWSVKTGRTQEEIANEMPARKTQQAAGDIARAATNDPMPETIAPMLASSSSELPPGEDWWYEIKWDGVRALCFLRDQTTRLVSRNGNSMDRQYPELSLLHHFVAAETAILDAEIVALDEEGRPSFSRLQPRIMATDPNAVAHLARTRPVVLYVFDLLYLNGRDLRQAPLIERKRLLKSVLRPAAVVRYSDHFEDRGRELLEAARAKGLEGIVAKRAASVYEARRSHDWIKIKVTHEQEFVVCGYTRGERDYFGALVLGIYDNGALDFAGSVGSGFDHKLLESLHAMLEPLGGSPCPFEPEPQLPQPVTWVRPELVCTVRFHSWTKDGRLRAPVFVGLRPDVAPRECVRESAQPAAAALRPPLLAGGNAEAALDVEGHTIRFKNLNKIFYPREGYTKRDILNYYDAVADVLLPHLKDRPLSLRRYPNGIEEAHFFQKNAVQGFPDWIRTEKIAEEELGKSTQFVIGGSRAALLYLANLGCIDQNPWMSRVGSLDQPDFLLIDLDPQDCGYDKIVEAAQLVRRKLEALGLEGCPKTTGGDGMHIYVPLEPVYSFDQTRGFAEILARLAAAERPDLFTTPRPLARREKGKVYFDYLQNGRGKTISAPYVLRAYPGAPVATPLQWKEVAPGLTPQQFHIRNAEERFARLGDVFRPVLENRQRLEPAMERLEKLVGRAVSPA